MKPLVHEITETEARLDNLGLAVLRKAPHALQLHAALLRDIALHLSNLVRGRSLQLDEQRALLRCSDRLRDIRANITRRALAVNRDIAALMPEAAPRTFDTALRGRGMAGMHAG